MGSPARRLTNPITRCWDQPHHRYAGTDDGRGTDQKLDPERLTLIAGAFTGGAPRRAAGRTRMSTRLHRQPVDAATRLCHRGFVTHTIEADYVVVGAGAVGMAFTDALTDHADVRVALVDRRHSISGHWLEAYPFVRLHQASALYGVASTLLGGGQLQQRGTEEGLQERASQAEICAYYARMLDRMLESGKVEFFPNSEYVGDRIVVSRISGERFEVPGRCR